MQARVMSIRAIEIACDTPDCGAFCRVDQPTADAARVFAAERWGWTRVDGRDVCNPCGRGDTPQARAEREATAPPCAPHSPVEPR